MNEHSKTPLFLMELIIMLFIFSVAAAISLRVFAEAKNIATESQALDFATIECQKAAELWKNNKGDLEQTAQQMDGIQTDHGFWVWYDKNWQKTDQQSTYSLHLSPEAQTATITFSEGETEILSFSCEAVMYGE